MKCPKCGYNSFEFLDSCKKCNNDLSGFKQNLGIRAIVLPLAAAAATGTAAATAFPPELSPAAATEESFTWEAPPAPGAPAPQAGDDIFSDLDLGFSDAPKPEPAEETFSFDLEPTAEPEPAPAVAESGFADFSFDEPPVETTAIEPPAVAPAAADDESFAGLLETDSHDDTLTAAVADTGAGVELENPWDVPTDSFGGFGEEPASASPAAEEPPAAFDLDNFGWEEEEKKAEPPPAAAKGPQVDLEGFGEFDALFGEPDEQKKD